MTTSATTTTAFRVHAPEGALLSKDAALKINLPEAPAQERLDAAIATMREDLELVERRLHSMLDSRVEGVPEMMAYLITAGGKRIRPLVTCLLARAAGYRGDMHIDVAAVAELLHTATLYHDDVVDEARLRRGKPSANSLFGNKIIVLAGDLMLAQSFSLLMEGGHFSVSRALSRTVRDMVEGEILQLKAEENFETTIDDYLTMIRHKTASLFAWCCQSAAMIAGKTPDECRDMAAFGEQIGLVFQLVDDMMDILGDEEATGKALFKDLREGKFTLPVLVAMKHNPALKTELQTAFEDTRRQGTDFAPRFLAHVQSVIRAPAVQAECRLLTQTALQHARERLQALPASIHRTHLFAVLEFLAQRDR